MILSAAVHAFFLSACLQAGLDCTSGEDTMITLETKRMERNVLGRAFLFTNGRRIVAINSRRDDLISQKDDAVKYSMKQVIVHELAHHMTYEYKIYAGHRNPFRERCWSLAESMGQNKRSTCQGKKP